MEKLNISVDELLKLHGFDEQPKKETLQKWIEDERISTEAKLKKLTDKFFDEKKQEIKRLKQELEEKDIDFKINLKEPIQNNK